jgi:hypothetical protein
MHVAGAPHGPADLFLSLEHQNRPAGINQMIRCHEPVRAGANDYGIPGLHTDALPRIRSIREPMLRPMAMSAFP